MPASATAKALNHNTAVDRLREIAAEIDAVGHALSLLGWDEQTKMPRNGAMARAGAKAALSGIHHELRTSDDVLRAIEAVEADDPDNIEARRMRRAYELSVCLPTEFVRELMETTSIAWHAWDEARGKNDFSIFAPHLEKVVDLTLRSAEYFGYETEPYDALVDQYEEGMTATQLAPMFEALRGPSRELLDRIPEPDWSLLTAEYDTDIQRQIAPYFAEAVGFDMERGRIDDTSHPFCSTIGSGDVRLTARYLPEWLPGGIFAVMHEAGHGVYEQGIQAAGLPSTLDGSAGLGTHESQSRMFENIVGRSLPFWECHYPALQRAFPAQLGDVPLEDFHRAINGTAATTIRVEADELTYNLHIGLRFELERALVNREIRVADLPEAWNAKMQEWLGIVPPSDAEGVLQDVHWSYGSIGYFPTYSLGNVYSAQYMEAVRRDIPDLDDQLRAGDVSQLRDWFQRHVYDHGEAYTGLELLERATGRSLDPQPLIEYLRAKFGPHAVN